jgi:phosphohistidine phosphatase
MKTILLLRHAKSDWSDPGLPDFDRPLAKRGLKDAPYMGEVLALFDCVPDKILASPALRARQTTEMVAQACGYKESIQWEDSFYGGNSEDLMVALQHLPNSMERAMLVGHNPTMEETAATLLSMTVYSEWNEAWSIRIPTAGLICLEVDITDWATLEPGDAILRWFLIPKLVKAIR